MSKTFTREEVAQHNNEKDAYLIINSKVYDVTSYVNEHPGKNFQNFINRRRLDNFNESWR